MDARERYEESKEALRVEELRRGLGQSTDAEVNGRRDDLATATNDLLREWWCGLSVESQEGFLLLDADDEKSGRLYERVAVESIDREVREILVTADGSLRLPGWLRDEPC
jgi:hypothetical protein